MNTKKVLAPVLVMLVGNAMVLGGVCLVCGIFTAPLGLTMVLQGFRLVCRATKECFTGRY